MPVLSRRPTSTVPGGRVGATGITVATIAAVALLVAASTALVPPAHVPSLSVTNPTEWSANVAVREAGQGGWLPLGPVPPGGDATLHEVLDVGSSWEIRFDYGDAVETTVVIDRADLAGGSWRVEVPDDFAQQAREAGLAPSATDG